MASLATASWSLPYYQILNEIGDLRRKKLHYNFENGYTFVAKFYFQCSYNNFTCYLSDFERFTAGAELFRSGILREWASDFPIRGGEILCLYNDLYLTHLPAQACSSSLPFWDATTHLYKRSCPSVCPSIRCTMVQNSLISRHQNSHFSMSLAVREASEWINERSGACKQSKQC